MIGSRWGVTDAEVTRQYPCDSIVRSPAVELWRGVTIEMKPEIVWRWVRQMRLAPYSYDWLDNFGRRSPRRLSDLPDHQPGQPFSCIGGRFAVGRVLTVVPQQQLTARIMGAVMSYVLTTDGQRTRLLLKIVMAERRWYTAAIAIGDWPMARRQLTTLKKLAEGG